MPVASNVCSLSELPVLTSSQNSLKQRIELQSHSSTVRKRLPKLRYGNVLRRKVDDVNQVLEYIPTSNITETISLIYAAAYVITEDLGYTIRDSNRCANSNVGSSHVPPSLHAVATTSCLTDSITTGSAFCLRL